MGEHHQEHRMVLAHEPVAGYRKFFFAALAAGVLYLGLIFWKTLL
ncbi:MAG: hypothetical protein WHX93_08835 [bacterium]